MTYATLTDFTETFGQEIVRLTNLYNPTATTVNTSVLLQAQRKSKALIDALIGVNPDIATRMPLSPPFPRLLISSDLDITRYYLDSLEARGDVRLRYEDAISNLRSVGAGKLALFISDTPSVIAMNERFDSGWETQKSYFEGVRLC